MGKTMKKMPKPSAPQIAIEDVILNADNPFKKKIRWTRLRCRVCGEIVLNKGIGSQKDWNKIRSHLKWRHNIEEDEEIPIRLLSHVHLRKWIRAQIKKRRSVSVERLS